MNTSKNALLGHAPSDRGPKANPAGLPSGRLFAILAYRSVVSGTGTLTTVYSTRDPDAFAEVLSGIRKDMIGKPKMRPHSSGNCREVGVVRIEDAPTVQSFLNLHQMETMPIPGQRWKSLKLAALALGLSPYSLRCYFAAAKRENGGNAASVVARGVRLSYTDVPSWSNLPADGVRPGVKLSDMPGGRISSAKAAEMFKGKMPDQPQVNQLKEGAGRI